ncbi:MAG: GNAT family N-acetyltransferase [Clostridia bacterium]|nr:GNAT family N-acetyltransferase [Clostridia bacterium]
MNITYRKATSDEVFKIYQHYVRVIESMQANGIYQWDNLYPNPATIAADVSAGDLIVGENDGEIILTYAVNKECEEDYEACSWQYPNEPFIVIHRLGVNPKYHRQGIAKSAMAFLENSAKEKGIRTIRLDTFCENFAGASFYEGIGFKTIGYAHWKKGKYQIMEKVLY